MRIFIIAAALSLAACANNPTGGAVLGGAAGGAAGAAVGYEVGGRDGAILGGAIGGAAGAAVGSSSSQPVQPAPPAYKKRGHDEEKHDKHRKRESEHDDD